MKVELTRFKVRKGKSERVDELVNFIIQSFRCTDTRYSGVKPFSTTTISCLSLAVLGNYEIDSNGYYF